MPSACATDNLQWLSGVIVKPRGVSVYNVNSLKQALLVAGEKQLKVLNKDGKVHALKIETEQVVRTWDTARNEVNLPQVLPLR